MQRLIAFGLVVGLAACDPSIPDSGAGVGGAQYGGYQSGQYLYDQDVSTAAPPATGGEAAPTAEVQEAGLGSTAGPILTLNNPGISSEQDFGAVSADRDIAADAERLEAARQQYQLVTPTELQRPGDTGPNIINYALATDHPIGAKIYRRNPFSARRAEAKCAGYRTADVAQEEFLAAGGPDRDRLGLDPDGDGYACGWDPATYRSLVRN